MSNLTTQKKFSVTIQEDTYKRLINNTLQDPKKAQNFIASISSTVAVNPALQECTAGSILSGALVGEALGLSPSPQLGQYYLVPYYDKKIKGYVAQFQLGYKGYIQLAIRSSQYLKLNVLAVKEGELVNFDPLTETIEINLIQDELLRESTKSIGYYAMFEYINGFRKALYWSKEKMLSHANKYSQAFNIGESDVKIKFGKDAGKTVKKVSFSDYEVGNYDKETEWLYSSFWYKDFDGMAFKTMLRQLISKWGIMSIDIQNALEKDMAVISQDGTATYVDNESDETVLTETTADTTGIAETDENSDITDLKDLE